MRLGNIPPNWRSHLSRLVPQRPDSAAQSGRLFNRSAIPNWRYGKALPYRADIDAPQRSCRFATGPRYCRRLLFAAPATLLLATPSHAGPVSDAQSWNALQISGPVIGPIVLASEITLRAGEQAGGLYQVEPLIALGIRLAPILTIYAGYGSVLNYADPDPETREARFYQEASIELGKFAGGTLSSRFRAEQRRVSDGGDTGHRVRARVKFVRPLSERGKISFVASHESFINLNRTDWGGSGGYCEMRNFIGLRQAPTKQFAIEAGYLNQYQPRAGTGAQMNHALALSFVTGF